MSIAICHIRLPYRRWDRIATCALCVHHTTRQATWRSSIMRSRSVVLRDFFACHCIMHALMIGSFRTIGLGKSSSNMEYRPPADKLFNFWSEVAPCYTAQRLATNATVQFIGAYYLKKKRKTNKGKTGNLRKKQVFSSSLLCTNDWVVLLWFSVVFSPAAVQPCSLAVVVLPFYHKVCFHREEANFILRCSLHQTPVGPAGQALIIN